MIRLQEIYLVFVCLSWIEERKWKRQELAEGTRRGKVKENMWKKKRILKRLKKEKRRKSKKKKKKIKSFVEKEVCLLLL